MTLTEANNKLGALRVQVDAFEREHGTNASRYTVGQLHEQIALCVEIERLKRFIRTSFPEHQQQQPN